MGKSGSNFVALYKTIHKFNQSEHAPLTRYAIMYICIPFWFLIQISFYIWFQLYTYLLIFMYRLLLLTKKKLVGSNTLDINIHFHYLVFRTYFYKLYIQENLVQKIIFSAHISGMFLCKWDLTGDNNQN